MNKTLILCTHNRPIHSQTVMSITALNRAGAAFIDHSDAPTDVTLGRNLGLSSVCEHLEDMPERDVVLLVDDDMVFTIDDAQALADHARASGYAASAMYATTLGALAACRIHTPPSLRQRWVTGLGLLAIPASNLLALRDTVSEFEFLGGTKYGFTQSAVDSGHFFSEDFTLCKRLGGVHVLPIPIGHMKQIAIYPDEETIACIRDSRPLTTDIDPLVLKGIVDPSMLTRRRESELVLNGGLPRCHAREGEFRCTLPENHIYCHYYHRTRAEELLHQAAIRRRSESFK